LVAAATAREAQLRAAIAADPALAPAAGAFTAIEGAVAAQRALDRPYTYVERGAGFQGELMGYARTLVRAAAERERPNGERLREYSEAQLPKLRQYVGAESPVYPALEVLRLQFGFEKLQEALGPDDPLVRRVLGSETPAALAARLVAGTRLGDAAARRALWDGGAAAVAASSDPLVVLARAVDGEARAIRRRYEDEVEAVLATAAEQLAAARFTVAGTTTYPDATFTLRLAWGTVAGWREGDADVAPFTDVAGLYARATGATPFALPPAWLDRRDRLDGGTRLNFATTADIIGGNSGSPAVNTKGEVIGLIFDGNIHSLPGAFHYDDRMNRAVAVDIRGLLEAMEKVYGAKELVAEIGK
jgi:hypothetical protein